MSTEHIKTAVEDGVMTVHFARPEKKNALTRAMYARIAEALKHANESPEVRVMVFRGEGEQFTAGNDIMDFMQDPPKDRSSPVYQFLTGLVEAKKPIIGAVEGSAIGVGSTMLLHFDLVYAAEDARFQFPFVNLGLVMEAASSVLLPRVCGITRANEILLFGESLSAEDARAIGMVNQVVSKAKLGQTVLERAQALAQKPIGALIDSKRLMKAPLKDEILAALEREAVVFGERLTSPEAIEAFTAFMEKRKPDFTKFSA